MGRWFEPLAGERFDLHRLPIPLTSPWAIRISPRPAASSRGSRSSPAPTGSTRSASIAREAPAHLVPGGWLLLEHGMGQHEAVRALLADAGLETALGWPDLAGIPRVAGGRR